MLLLGCRARGCRCNIRCHHCLLRGDNGASRRSLRLRWCVRSRRRSYSIGRDSKFPWRARQTFHIAAHRTKGKKSQRKLKTSWWQTKTYLSSSSLSEGMPPGPPKMMPPAVGGGGIELRGQAFRGEACRWGGELEVAPSFSSGSLAGELDDECASRILFRLAFFPAAAGFGSSSVGSVASAVSSSREVAEGTGESSRPFGSSSSIVVSIVGPFSGRGGRKDSTECP